MATAKLIINDVDLDTGKVEFDTEIEGSLVDDGQMTAAEVMIRVLHGYVTTPEFKQRCWDQVQQMTEGREGVRIANENQAPTAEDPAKETA